MPRVIKFPKKRTYHRIVTGREVWDQKEPSSEMVWEVCPYTRSRRSIDDQDGCLHCPRYEEDPDCGKVQRGCYAMAAEACRVVFAMQKRLDKKK